MGTKIQRGPEQKGKFVTQDVKADLLLKKDTGATKKYELTGLETENTKFNRVDIATATVVPKQTDYYTPEFNDQIDIAINGVPTYSGYVGEVTPKENATFELKCFNAVRKLKTTHINIGTEEKFYFPTSILEGKIVDKVGIKDYEISIGENTEIGTERKSLKEGYSYETPVRFEATEAPAMSVLEKLSEHTNSVWWFDGSGTFHFGEPKTEIYKLSYVKDASAGKTTPPYQSVKVIGGGGASTNSIDKSSLMEKTPTTVARSIKNVKIARQREKIKQEEGDDFNEQEDLTQNQRDVYEVQKGELVEPTFVYRDKSIMSKKEAQAIANAIITKLVTQTMQGYVKIVGWANIEPFDIIEMPDYMGSEQYLVQGVKHTLDTSNGFETRIEVGGLIDSGDEAIEYGAYE